MSTLFLIRHAQASFGSNNYDMLSGTGKKQALILSEYLHTINIQFDYIYSGTMERHKETAAEYISASKTKNVEVPEIRYDSRLNEYDAEAILKILIPVMISEKPYMQEHLDSLLSDKKSFQIVFSEIMNMWCSGKYEMKSTATWNQFISGVYGFIEEIMEKHQGNKNIAAFTSGGPISTIIMKVLSLNIDTTMLIRDKIVNSSITRFRYSENSIMLSSFNEYSHLELTGEKDIITYR